MSTELKQINMFDTIFQFAERYDPEIKEIKVYGILDENNRCSEPYFMANDVLSFLGMNVSHNSRTLKRLKLTNRELVKMKIDVPKNKKIDNECVMQDKCNMLTRYGMIRVVGLCTNNTKSSIALREFIYSLFDALDSGHTYRSPVYSAFNTTMESPDIQTELQNIDSEETSGGTYFINNNSNGDVK